MPLQLIFTSAPRGLVAGAAGSATAASDGVRSKDMTRAEFTLGVLALARYRRKSVAAMVAAVAQWSRAIGG